MQEQEMTTSTTNRYPGLNAAYGVDSDETLARAQKRSAEEAQLSQPPAKKNTVSVIIEENLSAPTSTELVAAAAQEKLRTVVEDASSIPDTKFEWRFLSSADHFRAVMKIADTLSANGDYLNINPDSEAYSSRFGERVSCGWNFQFQTPPMVSTTGLQESAKFEGQWGALLAGSDNMNLCTRLGMKPEVATHMAFLRCLQQYLNDYLIEHGENIFRNSSRRLENEAKGKPVIDKYKDVAFVTRGKNNADFGLLWSQGSYTKERYEKDVQSSIGTWFVAYEGNEPSVQVRAYPKKVAGARDNHTPDVLILNEAGDVENFDPKAPYCVGGATSWECLLKVTVKWYQNQFRFYLNMRSLRYYLNGASAAGNDSAQNQIIFTDANGNKRRVVKN